MTYDVAIIGAGVVGALAAREISKLNLKVALIEKCNDVAMGATKANSGIVHAGYDAQPGSVMAKLNVRGNSMMQDVCEKLHVPFRKNGSLVVAFSDEERAHLEMLLERGKTNGVPDLRIIEHDELMEIEPGVSKDAVAALFAPTGGIVCPYELTIAATECAVSNGVEFIRNCEVKGARTLENKLVILETTLGEIEARLVINAAGVHSDEIAAMFSDDSFKITPRRGEYFLLDRTVGATVSHTIFQCPTKMGKGVLVTSTVDGNLLVGPTAEDIEDKDGVETTWEGLSRVMNDALKSVPCVSIRDAITSFSGLRAHQPGHDFIIGVSKKNPLLINAAGIESPGLTSSPAIAQELFEIVKKLLNASMSAYYNDSRPAPVRFRHLSDTEKAKLIEKNPSYGRVICRCETVTEGEIIDAIHAPAGARDVDGVKRRTRAGMGRCQGGFCGSKVVAILSRELKCEMNTITKFGDGSSILFERTK